MMRPLIVLVILTFCIFRLTNCLFPFDSEKRQTKTLDGVWDFVLSSPETDKGFRGAWYNQSFKQIKGQTVYQMPVPASFNDITQEKHLRDYVGWVWYQRTFFVASDWEHDRTIYLRFDSVHYMARVYLNGKHIIDHTGGHLPFEVDVTHFLKFTDINLLTVAVNNTLSSVTVPQGYFDQKTGRLVPDFDFFNYAGIHRSVRLYAVPKVHVKDVSIITTIATSERATIRHNITYHYADEDNSIGRDGIACCLEVINAEQQIVSRLNECSGSVSIDNPHLWWPIGMSDLPGYLYTARISLRNGSDTLDVYYLNIGIRSVELKNGRLLVNGRKVYFRGFGRHEDSIVRGRGLDIPQIVKDGNLMEWIGANSFRTSHYPYSEELMDLADKRGFMVIDECPAVGLHNFSEELFKQHLSAITELIARDKNRPSVIAWSIANEPQSQDVRADKYFERIVSDTKSLDETRPVTAAIAQSVDHDLIAKHLDFLMINRYFGWYQDTGCTDLITNQTIDDLSKWHVKHRKPVMMSEYGADSVSGLHSSPSFVFTEDYQVELMTKNFGAFDELRRKGFFIGEMIWNFADFMTDQTVGRVVGNRKGIFTRDRQPKLAARILRCRYRRLGNMSSTWDAEFMICAS